MYYSGQEIVEIAVRIEENGNEFYTAAAEMIKESNDIKGLFIDLAEKEILHISIFQKLAEKFEDMTPEQFRSAFDLLEIELRDENLGAQAKAAKSEIVWPTAGGENWRDELGYYSVPIKSKC